MRKELKRCCVCVCVGGCWLTMRVETCRARGGLVVYSKERTNKSVQTKAKREREERREWCLGTRKKKCLTGSILRGEGGTHKNTTHSKTLPISIWGCFCFVCLFFFPVSKECLFRFPSLFFLSYLVVAHLHGTVWGRERGLVERAKSSPNKTQQQNKKTPPRDGVSKKQQNK